MLFRSVLNLGTANNGPYEYIAILKSMIKPIIDKSSQKNVVIIVFYDNDNQRDIIQELKREHLEMVCLIHIIQHLQNHNTVNSIEYNNFESLNSTAQVCH